MTTDSPIDHDPGWRGLLSTRDTVSGPSSTGGGPQTLAIGAARSLYVVLVGSLVAVGVVATVLAVLVDADGGLSAGLGALVVVIEGISSTAVAVALLPGLDCRDDAALAASWRRRMLVRIALGNGALVIGVAMGIATGTPALIALGVPFAVFGFAYAAPTRRHIARDQAALADRGCGRSLLAALTADTSLL